MISKSIFVILIISLQFRSAYAAELNSFILSGKITDESNSPVSFVSITIQELTSTAFSNKEGRYRFESIPSGTYHLVIIRNGFQSKTIQSKISDADLEQNIVLVRSLIETPTIDVTSSFSADEISNTAYSVTVIQPRNLTRTRNFNIAETIQNLPGVNNLSTGNSIGKPVIRGLSSQSVLIVHDGVKHESQQWGDEHGPEISLFNLDRIEILRGPASLIYGADGIGGVVNLISPPLVYSSSGKTIKYGRVDLNGFSVSSEGAGSLSFGLGLKNTSIKIYGSYRNGDNILTPDGEFTVNTPDGERIIPGGELSNTGSKEMEAGIAFGTKFSAGSISGSFENFNRELQIHEDPSEDPEATPNQKIVTNHFELKGNFNLTKSLQLEPIISLDNNVRKEYESITEKDEGMEILNLDLKVIQGDLRLHHKLTDEIKGTVGSSFIYQNNKSLAAEKLIPNYDAAGLGIYFMEKYERSNYTLTGGLRYDYKSINTKETVFEYNETGVAEIVVGPDKNNFQSVTGSAGFIYRLSESGEIYFNIGKGWRPPSEYELYVDGVHEGTNRYEVGLKINNKEYEPKAEESFNIEAGTRISSKVFNAEISFFRNVVNNFIYPSPTDKTDSASGYSIYDIRQDRSTFWGYEYSIQFSPLSWALLMIKGDYVWTENNASGNPLPLTPPMKNIFEIKIQNSGIGFLNNPYFNIEAKFVSSQTRVDEFEFTTDSYTLFSTGLGFDLIGTGTLASVDFSITNLFDAKYTDHLSRYKYYAMNPGRSFNLKISLPFHF